MRAETMLRSDTFPLRRSVVCVTPPLSDLPEMSGKYNARY
jgi:hypothetical protein